MSSPVFGPDGTVYFLARVDVAQQHPQHLVALDRAGRLMAGWPVREHRGADFGSPAVGPDGSVYVEECAGAAIGCVLHRLGTDGRDRSGWPIALPSDFACSTEGLCQPWGLYIGLDGTAFVSHWRGVLAVDPSGKVKPGWPVAPGASGGLWWTDVQLGADGTLFMLGTPDDGIQPATSITAFGPDGKLRPGWPVAVPARSRYVVGPQGAVVVWSLIDDPGGICSSPRRTLYTVLGPDGQTQPGWPRGSTGHASSPAVSADGTVYYISATNKIYAHDRTGEVKSGWPVPVPWAGAICGPGRPNIAPDGTVYVVGDEVTALAPDGSSRPGWPYRPAGSLTPPHPPYDTDGTPAPVNPAFGPDGTVYLVVFHTDSAAVRADVVALDRGGQLKPGWPYRLPFAPAWDGIGLAMSPDGRLSVRNGDVLLALDPDGGVSD